MPEVNFETWKKFLINYPDAHILQLAEWGELKRGFGWDAIRIVVDNIGAQILFRRLPFGFTVAYIPKPVFSYRLLVVNGQKLESNDQLWNEIDNTCKKHRAIFLKIEPDTWDDLESSIGNHQSSIVSPHNIQPPRTVVVDLRGSEEEILGRMKQKCRYNIRLAEKKGIVIRASDDIESYHNMMLVTGGRDGFGVHSLEYYKKAYSLFHPQGLCELLIAEFENKPLAGLMVFAHGKRAYYLYGASTDEERNRMPTYLLQWEAMKWARSKGCEEYDLWGVPDEDEQKLEADFESRHDGLWGVYRFKRGFGGVVKRAAQALDRVYSPLLYKFYIWRFAERE